MKRIFLSMFLFLTVLGLVACGGTSNSKLTSEDISYNGSVISWSKDIKDAEYIIQIDNGDSQSFTSNSFSFNSNDQSFEIKLTVKVPKLFGLRTQEYTIEKTFKVLGTVTNVKYNEQTSSIVWDKVESAEYYDVIINGGNPIKATGTTYEFKEAGSSSIKVQAKGNSTDYYSKASETYEMRILEVPRNPKYDNIDGNITWGAVSGATSYTIYIDGQPLENGEELTKTSFLYDPSEKNFELQVVANGNSENNVFSSSLSEKETYIFLDNIVNIDVVDGILKWDAVENATGYELSVSAGSTVGDIIRVSSNSYDGLVPGISYTIKARAISNAGNFFSKFVPTDAINILSAPLLRWENETILWDQKSIDDGYTIELSLNGNVVSHESTSTTNAFYQNSFTDVGEYKIRVKANGQGSYYDSKYSEPMIIHRLPAPTKVTLVDDYLLVNSLTRVELVNIPGSSGYQLYSDNVEINKTNNNNLIFTLAFDKENTRNGATMQVKVKTLGKKQSDLEYYLDSLTTYDFDLTKLAVPVSEINQNTLTWNSVLNAEGYVINVDGKITKVPKGSSSQLLDILSPGNHTISIRAIGNGSNIVSSDFDNEHSVHKLPVPSNVRIENEVLRWGNVERSDDYVIDIGSNEPVSANNQTEFGGLRKLGSLDAQEFRVKAAGDGKLVIDSEYSKPQSYYILDAPKNLDIDSARITFNSVRDNSGYQLEVGGNVSLVVTSNFFPHGDYIKEAGNYNLRVRAIGNGGNIFTSEYTEPLTVTKLEAPKVRLDADNKSLTWDLINDASGYRVNHTNQDNITNLGANTNKFIPNITTGNRNIIHISALGNDKHIIGSNATTLEINGTTLSVPKIEKVVSDRNVTINVIDAETYNSNVKFVFRAGNNDSEPVRDFSRTFENRVEGNHSFDVYAYGKYMIETGTNKFDYFLNSQPSSTENVTFLRPLNDIIRNGNRISWTDPNSQANRNYEVSITFYDVNTDVIGTITERTSFTNYELKNIPETATSYRVNIIIKGDGVDSFDSTLFTKLLSLS